MEAEVFDAQLLHYLKSGVHLVLGTLHGIVGLVPLIRAGLSAKLVGRCAAEGMPPCHGKLQPVFHLLSHDHLLGVIVVESHHVFALRSFERNLSYLRKILFCHNIFSLKQFLNQLKKTFSKSHQPAQGLFPSPISLHVLVAPGTVGLNHL